MRNAIFATCFVSVLALFTSTDVYAQERIPIDPKKIECPVGIDPKKPQGLKSCIASFKAEETINASKEPQNCSTVIRLGVEAESIGHHPTVQKVLIDCYVEQNRFVEALNVCQTDVLDKAKKGVNTKDWTNEGNGEAQKNKDANEQQTCPDVVGRVRRVHLKFKTDAVPQTVYVDGREVTAKEKREGLILTSGDHYFSFEGEEPKSSSDTARNAAEFGYTLKKSVPRDKRRDYPDFAPTDVDIELIPPIQKTSPNPDSKKDEPVKPVVVTPPDSGSSWPSIFLAGSLSFLVAGGIVLIYTDQSLNQPLKNNCSDILRCPLEYRETDRIRHELWPMGLTFMGVGGALLAGAGIAYAIDKKTAKKTGTTLLVSPGYLGVSGRF